MKIIILDDYQNVVPSLSCFSLLKDFDVEVLNETYSDTETLISKISDVNALVLIRERTKIDNELLSRLPNLKLISQTGKISNHLDLAACTENGVAVAEGRGSPIAPAELCWSLIMAASRHIPAYVQNLKQGKWQNSNDLGLGRRLSGLTMGIWGYGKIGKKIAKYAQAFDMNVLVWGSESSRKQALEDGYQMAESKDDFFANSDVLSLHLRLVESTKGCVSADDLALMKTDALFVNTSRAELVEDNALYNAIKAGRPYSAAVDVYNNEPVTSSNEPLLNLDNVICSPHLGYVEQKGYELYFEIAFENVVNYFDDKPSNLANADELSHK